VSPYYQDDYVTIYHLASLPMCDNISLDKCMEVGLCLRKQLEDIERGKGVRIFPSEALGQRRDINKPQNIYRNESDLGQTTTPIRVRILLSSLVEHELCVNIPSDLARDAATSNQSDITKMAMLETIAQKISSFFAEDVICLRMVG